MSGRVIELERHTLTDTQRARLPGLTEAELDAAHDRQLRAMRAKADHYSARHVPIDYADTDPEPREVAADVDPWSVEAYAPAFDWRHVLQWALVGLAMALIFAAAYWSELADLRELLRARTR